MSGFARCNKGATTLRLALGFAAFGLLAAFLAPPLAEKLIGEKARLVAAVPASSIDRMTTGSVQRGGAPKTGYVVRRSVLQPKNSAPCILYNSGRREGNC